MSMTQSVGDAPVLTTSEPLALFWNKPLSTVATLPKTNLTDEQAERHRIYALGLMSLVRGNWNGNKRGMIGIYPGRERQKWQRLEGDVFLYRSREQPDDARQRLNSDYLGHNIACLAVDGDGDIIDFDFNHNDVFSSSVEHAESRLVRRVFSLTQLTEGWNLASPFSSTAPATNLSNVTLYTSLEPCAQCAGIMTLAAVKEVIYLQKDYGTYCIGNILYNLTPHDSRRPSVSMPRPIPGEDINLEYYTRLNAAYKEFFSRVADEKFWSNGLSGSDRRQDGSGAITSFLCTDIAYGIYQDAVKEFNTMDVRHPQFVPSPPDQGFNSGIAPAPKTNQEVLTDVRHFVDRMLSIGRRGTPHKL